MSKRDKDRRRWIEETRRFQRIAGVTEDTDETLGGDWDKIYARKPTRTCKAAADNAETQRTILQAADRAGQNRNN